jgi:PD-(D/E)XK nuclease superfamily
MLKPKRATIMAFEKGSYIHELLHFYYSFLQAGYELNDPTVLSNVVERISEDLQEAENPDYKFYKDVSKTIVDFIKTQSLNIDKNIKNLQVESHLEIEYNNRLLHGYCDLIYEDSKGITHIRDHKSGQRNTYSNQTVQRMEQLLFYGTLYWKLTGKVAKVEVSFIHSNPPDKPKPGTIIYGLYEADHNASTYEKYWNHLVEVNRLQMESQIVPNYGECTYCAYYPICRADLRGYSSENIIKANYVGPLQKQNSGESGTVKKPFSINFRG